MASILQIRRDTASDWTSNNPTLSLGELGIETDTMSIKIGDGSTAWTSLGYSKLKPTTYNALTTLSATDRIITYDVSASDLCYITSTNLGIYLLSSGTTSTSIATDDTITFYDTSGTSLGQITEENFTYNQINNRTALTAIDSSDYLLLSDTSDSAPKKITALNFVNSIYDISTTVTSMDTTDMIYGYDISALEPVKMTLSNLSTTLVDYAYTNETSLTELADDDTIRGWDTSADVPIKITASNLALDLATYIHDNGASLSTLADDDVLGGWDTSEGEPMGITAGNLPAAIGCMKLRSTVSASITTATTLTDTGLTVDVPAGKPFFIICRGGWTNNYCTELSVSNTYGVVFSKEYSGDGQQSFCASYCGYEPVSRTYALYAKYAGASSNTVYMYLFY